MRVLSLGHRLQHRSIDNHTILNAPNLADYHAIVLDPAATFDVVRAAARAQGEFVTHADVPVVNGDSSDATAGLATLLQRRRDEMARALENGATVCVFLAPQSRFHGVTGLGGFDRYFFLPAPDGMGWDEEAVRGSEGTQVAVEDHAHPFIGVYGTFEKAVLYRAVLNERAPGFAKHARVFIRAAGGDPVGVEFPVLNGRVVFMPYPKEPGANWLAGPEGSAMVEAMSESLGRRDEVDPRWAKEFMPAGLEERETLVRQARATVDQAQAALEAAEAEAAALHALRAVLWSAGDTVLLPSVLACAEEIGFKRAEAPSGEPVLTDGATTVQLAVAGSTEAVDMAPHYRLRQRLDRIIEARAIAPRGLVVANGQRLTHPTERKREFVDALRVAAEAVGYALVTAPQLYRVAHAARAGAPETMLAEARRRLATTDGLVDFDDLFEATPPPASEEQSEATPEAQE
ncbi:MAG: hypothetical protein M0R73_01090 [Dehalococcoidia bacterium]|nr:hypothetical protein [Dehalococcoidia bacterium]